MSGLIFFAAVGIFCGVMLAKKSHKMYSPLPKELRNRPWLAGVILAMVNLLILCLTVLPFFLVLFTTPPPLTVIIYWAVWFGGPFLSVYVWLTVKYMLGGGMRKRLITALVGQSIYLLLLIYLIDRYVANFRFLFFGDHPVMQAFDSMLAGFICFSALLIGIIAITFPMPLRLVKK